MLKEITLAVLCSGTTAGGITTTTSISGTVFEYDDVQVYTLYADQSRDWFSLIRKRQSAMGVDRDFSISHYFDSEENAWLLYNDLPENMDIPMTEEPANLKEGRNKMATVLCKVDPKGNVTRKMLFTKKEISHWFVPQSTQYPGDGTALLTAVSKKSYRMGKIRITD